VDEESAAGHAELSGEDGERLLDFGQRFVQVGIVEQQNPFLTAEFATEALHVLGAGRHDRLPGLGTAGQVDDRHIRRVDHRPRAAAPDLGEDVDYPPWQTGHVAERPRTSARSSVT